MTEPLIADRYAPVEWDDKPVVIDTTYTENVELIPNKASQAIMSPMNLDNHVDALFEWEAPPPFAHFEPFPGYRTRLRKLFFRQILSSFDPDDVVDRLDDLFEKGFQDPQEEAEKLYEMLQNLGNLNQWLEEIILNILSTLKP